VVEVHVDFIRQALVLMTERAVSAIDKRTDAEIIVNSGLRTFTSKWATSLYVL